MLVNAPVSAAIAASNFERAKEFYRHTLGLKLVDQDEGSAVFECGNGTRLMVYPSQFAGTNQATAAGWDVKDLVSEMDILRKKGVEFEEYDFPDFKTVDGIAQLGEEKSAWFKDTEGNILAIYERA